MTTPIKFALNHMLCPKVPAETLIDYAVQLGLDAIELRNDVNENSLTSVEQAKAVGAKAKEAGVKILTINAIYPFNVWDDELKVKTEALAELAGACGAEAIVLCPLNDGNERTKAQVKESLTNIKSIFDKYGLKGYVEPLGFPISSLRTKAAAVEAIKELGFEDTFKLVHDTFHHKGAGETEVFAKNTGLVHISGVEDPAITFEEMLDEHRLMVGPEDRLDNVGQIKKLVAAGYTGYFAFEPFSAPVWDLPDHVAAAKESMQFILDRI
ncbi:TIM barrel protein [Vibrio viridaestus]|uniref:Xylose isomerase n=1 Tax=Vibrio viridaestus TaxID=2487322 RepID=A0A3N9TEI3_9VIBR|nr:TIM barrel protein [Vibrio viridaestus]RQW62648.1 xylose isomerase [Vibrio viridaestus]